MTVLLAGACVTVVVSWPPPHADRVAAPTKTRIVARNDAPPRRQAFDRWTYTRLAPGSRKRRRASQIVADLSLTKETQYPTKELGKVENKLDILVNDRDAAREEQIYDFSESR